MAPTARAPTASRLQVGRDVPWVTSWSEEPLLGVAPCATVDGALAIHQAEHPGQGRPQYSQNHLRRQRHSVRALSCPMCGAPTLAADRWTLTARLVPAGVLRAQPGGPDIPARIRDAQVLLDAGSVSPLHRACAERAAEHCPHLQADPNLKLMRFPDRWLILPLFVEATPEDGPQDPVPVISFLQLCGITGDSDLRWRRRLG